MRDLLFLAHRIPYPPDKGDKIRSWNILRHLAQRHRVHLGCFIDDPRDRAFEPKLREICGECCFVELSPRAAKLRSLRGLLTGAPLTLPYYRSAALAAWTRDVMARHRPDHIVVFSSAMAQYVDAPTMPARRIIDFVDVDSQKWSEYAGRQRWPLSWIHAREGRKLLQFERDIAGRADASVFVSAAESALFAMLAPESRDKLHAVSNGVDTAYFSPERAYDAPFAAQPPVFVFTGAMDYWPNIDAVTYFAKSVLPLMRARCAGAAFWIVGSNPSRAVLELGRIPGVVVTGRVPDVRPYLAHATAVVAPLRIARGLQNKVLEAMAMARPVVGSPPALEGIGGVVGRDYLAAADAEAFAAALGEVAASNRHERLGAQARNYVLATYDWQKNLSRLDEILAGADAQDRAALSAQSVRERQPVPR